MSKEITKVEAKIADGAIVEKPAEWISVFCQDWEESERGWGTRPDGHTLHLTKEAHREHVKNFYDNQHKIFLDHGLKEGDTPDEYTRIGNGFRQIAVRHDTWEKVRDADAEGKPYWLRRLSEIDWK